MEEFYTCVMTQLTVRLPVLPGSAQHEVAVAAADYMDDLTDQALLSVTVLALVKETGQSWVGKAPYRLRRPDLAITVDGKEGEQRVGHPALGQLPGALSLMR